MGFPHPTYDVPGRHEELARVAESAILDPFGHARQLADALRGGTAPAGHVCATAWVLDPGARSSLLVRHRTLGWVEPGGHVEVGEEPMAAAGRELVEETGIADRPHLERPALVHAAVFPARDGDPAHHHWNIGYLFVVDQGHPLDPEPGAPVAWWPVDGVPSPFVPDIPVVLPLLRPLVFSSPPRP